MKFKDISNEEAHIGARVNKFLCDLLKTSGVPISSLVRAGINYFFTLEDHEKVKFIHNYSDNIREEDIIYPQKSWNSILKDYMEEKENVETLYELLINADSEDLEILIKLQENDPEYLKLTSRPERVARLIRDIETNGGNTIMNLIRDGGVPYDEIIRDVAKSKKIPHTKETRSDALERALFESVFEEYFKRLNPEEQHDLLKKAGVGSGKMPLGSISSNAALVLLKGAGFTTYKMAVVIANATAYQILGKGLAFGVNTGITKSLGVALGPIGMAFTGAWLLNDLAGPAYRITAPSVLQIGYIREKYRETKKPHCPKCSSIIDSVSNFCFNCGERLVNNK